LHTVVFVLLDVRVGHQLDTISIYVQIECISMP